MQIFLFLKKKLSTTQNEEIGLVCVKNLSKYTTPIIYLQNTNQQFPLNCFYRVNRKANIM